jgi:hypothetical protein
MLMMMSRKRERLVVEEEKGVWLELSSVAMTMAVVAAVLWKKKQKEEEREGKSPKQEHPNPEQHGLPFRPNDSRSRTL